MSRARRNTEVRCWRVDPSKPRKLSLGSICSYNITSVGAGLWINLSDSASNEAATSRENITADFIFFSSETVHQKKLLSLSCLRLFYPGHCSESLQGEQLLIPILLYLPELFPALYLSTTAQTHRCTQAFKDRGFQSELSA